MTPNEIIHFLLDRSEKDTVAAEKIIATDYVSVGKRDEHRHRAKALLEAAVALRDKLNAGE
jgi:hypothetical protein